ncbi:MAG TPA: glycosyltransferase [Rhodanobacteraceae bacterium]|nr:glycosyltransferase [Rhodanobacteraceae bacterium]
MSRRILFAIHDWGLGHASRSLLLIRALLDRGDNVIIVTAPGGGWQLLQSELGGACRFIDFKDIPKPFSRWPALFYLRMSLDTPLILARFMQEHRFVEKLAARERIDCIISDSRFGMWSHEVPSYCILHSLRQIIPGRPRRLEQFVEYSQRRLTRHFRRILIPDIEAHGGLSGDLGHDPALDWGTDRLRYIGPLSGIQRMEGEPDIDCFFSISGIEPQLSMMAEKVLDALPHLGGNIVVTLGRPEQAGSCRQVGRATVYGYLDRRAQGEMLNRARLVMTRSGYTTLMELAELGKRALFVPTPGQSEQEYLARFHHDKGRVYSTTQSQLDLVRDIPRAMDRSGLPRISSAESVARFLAAID